MYWIKTSRHGQLARHVLESLGELGSWSDVPRTKILRGGSTEGALLSDWERVGKDMRKVVREVSSRSQREKTSA